MVNPAETFATPRTAAGALFVDGENVLLVRKTYGNRWDLPGGYVERGESPAAGCHREVLEEMGIDRKPKRLLVHDWAPNEEGDKILYVFSCGDIGTDQTRIQLDGVELDRWEWVHIGQLDNYVIPRLVRRITRAFEAHGNGTTVYLEHGEPVLSA
jgi:8-oxo-dGTP diphosphatase